MLGRSFVGLAFAIIGAASVAQADGGGDAATGEGLFRQCASCHMIGENATNRVGPNLTNIVGATVGSVADFRYSKAMIDAGQNGTVWDSDRLDAFLVDPRNSLPGNRMSFRGVKSADDRAHLIAYLRSFSGDSATDLAGAGFTVAPEVLAIAGDVAYGEYLGSECKACHLASGGDDGIPNIVGLSTDDFAIAMHAYRAKYRENQVMQLVAGRLDDEEIAALAAYFKDLKD